MLNRPIQRLKMLNEDDCIQLHEATLKVMSETGILFHSEEALAILKRNGAKISEKTVYFPPDLVKKSLDSCPSSFPWEARNEKHSAVCGGAGGVLVRPNSGCMQIQGVGKTRRSGTMADLINFQKLHQASDVLNLVGCIPIHPSDVPSEEKHLHILYQTLKHTDKPLNTNVYRRAQVIQMLEMTEIAMGHPIHQSHSVCLTATPLSPLAYGEDVIDSMIEYAKRNQPIQVADCAMTGITGPMDLMGTVILQNAEILAGVVLIQCINPGNPLLYGPLSSVADMKTGSFISGSPEMMVMNSCNLQLAIDLYNLPTRSMCGMTDSKTVDYQAGLETMQNMMMGVFSGADMISESMGILSDVMAISYEKFILDEEILRRILRITQGVQISEQTISLDVIKEVGPGGNFLLHQNTLDNCRNRWAPTISDWRSYDDWVRDGAMDAADRAESRYKEILQNTPESLLDPEIDKALKEYMSQALN